MMIPLELPGIRLLLSLFPLHRGCLAGLVPGTGTAFPILSYYSHSFPVFYYVLLHVIYTYVSCTCIHVCMYF